MRAGCDAWALIGGGMEVGGGMTCMSRLGWTFHLANTGIGLKAKRAAASRGLERRRR